jgi:hypothetical protein
MFCDDCTDPAVLPECADPGTNNNPDLSANCAEISIAFVLDESGSVSGNQADVENGTMNLLSSLSCTGASVAMIEFNGYARYLVSDYEYVDDAYVTAAQNYFDDIAVPFMGNEIYEPGGYPGNDQGTNWQAALLAVDELPFAPDLVIFLTDGIPTGYSTGANPTYNGPFDYCSSGASTQAPEIVNPIKLTNKLKGEGSHIFVVGVGNVTVASIEEISGTTVFSNGVNNIGNSDYAVGSFAQLANGLAALVADLCPFDSDVTSADICEGSSNGSIFISVPSNLVPFNYEYYRNNVFVGSGNNINTTPFEISGLIAGNYRVEVEVTLPGSGCTRTEIFFDTINTGAPLLVSSVTSTSNPTCLDPNAGSATLTVTVGPPPYVIMLKKAGVPQPGFPDTTNVNPYNVTGLDFGNYTLEIYNVDSCNIDINPFTLTEPTNCCPTTCTITGGPGGNVCPNTQASFGATADNCTSPSYSWAIINNNTNATISGSSTSSTVTVNNGTTCGTYTIQSTLTCSGCDPVVCTQVVNVVDVTDPVITTCAVTRNIEGCNTAAITGPAYATTSASSSEAEFENGTNQGVASDNCGITSVTYIDVAVGTCPTVVTRTWTITDACGNDMTCNQTINVDDTVNPTITTCAVTRNIEGCGPSAITGPAYSTVSAASTEAVFENGTNQGVASDACGITSVTYIDVAVGTCPVVVTRTWTISDACGNTSTCNQIINVDDNTVPVINCPSNLVLECSTGANYVAQINAWIATATASDLCDMSVAITTDYNGVNVPPLSCTQSIGLVVVFTATDDCGNIATCSRTIYLDDSVAPVITTCPMERDIEGCGTDDITSPAFSTTTAASSLGEFQGAPNGGATSDACGITSVTYIDVAVGMCPIVVSRTWTITDGCGNTNTCVQTINVDDTTPPVLAAAPANVTVDCLDDVPVMTNLTWTDNCDAGGSVAGVDGPLVGGSCGGTITRTWNVMDACNNAAITRTQTITVDDNIAPVLAAAPAAITVECVDDVPAMTNLTWTDNCDAGGSVAGVDGPLVGGPCGGTITRSWNVMDACGNAAITRTQTITVDDNTAPVLAAAPIDITVECIDDVPAMTSLTWTDNCDAGGSVPGVDGLLIGGACGGTITRTWNVMDACGNPAITRTQVITVDDNTAPVLAAAPAAITVECIDEVPAMTNLAWTDNCDAGGSVAGVDGPLVGGECGGTITRTWNVMDACGNPAITRTQVITVDDNTAPVLAAAPAAITVECIDEVPAMTNLAWTDNCDAGGSVAGVDGPLVGGECGGTITRTWNVMDACGNPAITRTQVITVDDNTAPVLAPAPAAITVECIDDVPAMTSLTWTDNCDAGGSVPGVDGLLVGTECGGTITRTWNVMDACGNPAITRTQVITVDDNTAPVLAAAPAAITVECIDDVPAMTSLTWTDNCDAGGSVPGVDGLLVGTECGGTITRTWNVMDACGNPAITRTQVITVDDNTAPVLAPAPPAITVECIDDVPAMTSLTWTDNCDAGGSVPGVDGPLVGGACGGTITRSWNVMDACGNAAITRTQTITVDDNIAPVLAAAPPAITVECIDDVPAMTSLTWTDNCDAGGSVPGVDGPLVGSACGGTITRSWNVMDACGNAAITRTQTITVDDNTAPVLAAAPPAITVECIDDVPAMTSLTWTDNCDAGGSVAGVDGPLVGGACGGTITRSWNVMDACGNAAITRTQTITVDDNTAPVLAAAPIDVTVECIDDVPAMTSLTWTDNCDAGGSVPGVDGLLIGGACGGTITRTWNVMDACGNAAITRTQTITVDDNTAPVLAAAPPAITVECIDDVPAMTNLTWTDNCDAGGSVAGVDGPLVGGACGGTITRSWNVMDACGNAAITRTQTITVDDNTAPVLAAAPIDVTVECIDDVPAMTSLTWTDNCDAGGSVAGVDGLLIGGACGGTITRTWNVMDACGNAAITRTQVITVDDNTDPVLAPAPPAITVECIDDVPAMTSLTWTDNCDAGGSVPGVDGPLVGGACGGTITRSWNVMDACGNAAITRTQTITVDDNTAPVLAAAPIDVTVECIDDVPAMTSLTWTDNCDAGGSVPGVDGPLVGGACGGTITRSWNVMDACGNAAITRTQTITVDDNTAPVLAAAPIDVTVECIEDVPAMSNLTWTDNCDAGGSVAGVDGPLVGGACGGTITRTWNVMDACGNAAITRTQRITVDDNTAPVLAAAPIDLTVECIEDVPSMTNLTWTDNCDAGGSVTGADGPLVGGECGGTITRTWNVMDACGNAAITRTQIITVDDTQAPVWDVDACENIGMETVNANADCEAVMPDLRADALLQLTDNCDELTVADIIQLPAPGSALAPPVGFDGCGPTGAVVYAVDVTFNVMDFCNNAAVELACAGLVKVQDVTAPTWNVDACENIGMETVNANADCEAVMPDLRADALAQLTENCDVLTVADIIQVPAPGSPLAPPVGFDGCGPTGAVVYTVDVTFNVTDCNGNAAVELACADLVKVQDVTAPTWNVDACDNIGMETVNANADCEAVMPDLRADALAQLTENCDVLTVADIIQVPAPGSHRHGM